MLYFNVEVDSRNHLCELKPPEDPATPAAPTTSVTTGKARRPSVPAPDGEALAHGLSAIIKPCSRNTTSHTWSSTPPSPTDSTRSRLVALACARQDLSLSFA